MELSTHPLLSLVESNANELKSLLTSYIDATVDGQFNVLKQNVILMIQSGQIGGAFDHTLPPQPIQENVNQSSLHLNSTNNHQLIGTTNSLPTQHNILQNVATSPLNTINKTEPIVKQELDDDADEIDITAFGQTLAPLPVQMIKQEFNDDDENEEEYDSGEEIDENNVANCVKCEKEICYSDGDDNYDDTSDGDDSEMEENRIDEHFIETRANVDNSLEDNQINQSASSDDDIFPSAATHANPIEPLIKQEYLKDSPKNDTAIDQPSSANGGNVQLVHENNDNQQSNPTSSGVRSSARKRIPKIAFDYDQLNKDVIKRKRTKRKSVQSKVVSVPVKKVKPKIVEVHYNEDDDKNDEREDVKQNKTVILELHCTESDCDKVVCNRSLWREHMKNYHQKTPYHQVENNVRTNDRDQTLEYPCPEAKCNCVYKSHKSCGRHWSHHHHPGKYKCPTCAFEDNLYYKVQHHLDTVHGAHECTHNGCGRKFSRVYKLTHHQTVHSEERPYWCVWPGCRLRFKHVSVAMKHVRVTHFKVHEQNDQNVVDSRNPHEFIVKKVRRLVQASVD